MGNDQSKKRPTIDSGPGDDVNIIILCNIFCFHELTMINVLENDKIIQRSDI